MEIKLNSQNFEQEVLKAEKPVLVDFWASWCGPCSMLSPIIEEIANEYDGKIIVGKVNVDEEMNLAINYGINSIPALFLFENGQVKKKTIGYMNKNEVEDFINK